MGGAPLQIDSVETSAAGAKPQGETKFVDSAINFNTDKGVDKKADQVAQETAAKWCSDNSDWEYTGVWKNVPKEDSTGEISQFQVRKKAASGGS